MAWLKPRTTYEGVRHGLAKATHYVPSRTTFRHVRSARLQPGLALFPPSIPELHGFQNLAERVDT